MSLGETKEEDDQQKNKQDSMVNYDIDKMNAHQILGIEENTTCYEIKQDQEKIRKKARDNYLKKHPYCSEGEKERLSQKIERAYLILSDPLESLRFELRTFRKSLLNFQQEELNKMDEMKEMLEKLVEDSRQRERRETSQVPTLTFGPDMLFSPPRTRDY